MKLSNSILSLKKNLDKYIFNSERDKALEYLAQLQDNPRVKDWYIAYIWTLWYRLPVHVRDEVIGCSVSTDDFIGGYWQSVNDSHIETLLKRAIPKIETIRLQVAFG